MKAAVETNVTCRGCGHEFGARPKFFFAGLQSFKCPQCRETVVYPLKRGWRTFWWVIAILTVGAGISANVTLHEGYSWIPSGIGVVSFVALCCDVGVRQRVDRATRTVVTAAPVNDGGIAAPQARATARPVAATPRYVAVLTLVIALATMSSVLGAFIVAGLNASYETVIVDRAAAEPIEDFVGYDLVGGESDICQGGQDYWACTAMHNTMWNALCTSPNWQQTQSTRQTCADLRIFIDDAWERYKSCGSGCETSGGNDAKWGWSYLSFSPSSNSIPQPSITHVETCYFALGPVKLGYCPRD